MMNRGGHEESSENSKMYPDRTQKEKISPLKAELEQLHSLRFHFEFKVLIATLKQGAETNTTMSGEQNDTPKLLGVLGTLYTKY